MNKQQPYFENQIDEAPEDFQVLRLKELISEIVQCCEDRRIYERGRFGVPYAELKCLMLFENERYLTPKDMAARLDVAKSRVTKLLSNLEKRGLVQKMDDPADARVKLIRLTSKGKEKTKEIDTFHREIHGKVLCQLLPEERGRMINYVERLWGAMEVVKKDLV